MKFAAVSLCLFAGQISSMQLALGQDGMANQAEIQANTLELVDQGLRAAAAGDYEGASGYLYEASRISEHPVVEHLAAVVETMRSNPGEAFDYAKKSGMRGAGGEFEQFGREQAQIVEWSRPYVIGTNRDCVYRPKDTMSTCEIERKGVLEALVKKYFKVEYSTFWWSHEKEKAEQAVPCPYVEIGSKDPELEPDTPLRCEARRVFHFYEFPAPPKVSLPAPGFKFRW